MSTPEKGQRITEFLNSGAWHIAEDRVLTRRAIFDALQNLPDGLLSAIFANLRILVVAPARRRVSSIVPYTLSAEAALVKFSVIHMDARLETYEPGTVYSIVVNAFGHAFASLAAIERPASSCQDEQAPKVDTVEGRPN